MFRFYIIFIFLCVVVSGVRSENLQPCNLNSSDSACIFKKADDLFMQQNYELAAVEYERCFYLSSSKEISYKALQQKAICFKQTGDYSTAAATLERIAEDYGDYYQIALCYYLSDNFQKSKETIEKCRLYFDTLQEDMLLLEILTLNELNDYANAEKTAQELALRLKSSTNKDIMPYIDKLYSDLPKLKSEKTARILSFVPGLAHIYANEWGKGLTAFAINAAALGFGVWQVLDKCYITAYLGGAGLLSITYPGAMKNGVYEVRKYNYRKTLQFNQKFKQELIPLLPLGE